jgi:type VI secretion system secreted protein VgrG
MEHQVVADIEIEDEKIDYYSSIVIKQQFNAHHEFAIRIRYDVLEKIGAFKLSDAQKKIGKLAIIKLRPADSTETAYEFRGLICEISMEQSDNFTSTLVLKGYSPTILLESGPHLLSFYQKGLKQIVEQVTQSLSQSCRVTIKPQYKSQIKYICQYRESAFHFLNRLSSDFGEWCYYDGIDLFFGKPSSSPNVEIVYGNDVHQLQLKLRILPLTFNGFSYVSKDDKFINYDAPSSVDGLDEYASYALQESNKIFTEPVSFPIRQRVESKSDLEGFVKQQKKAMSADLEVLSGSSDNPSICIGAIADVKVSTRENNALAKDEYGKFLITSIEHHLTENKKYYNNFEGIPAGSEVIPVKNIVMPIAEPQIATVMDNADPDNMGRIRVQMLWQKESGGMTDWLRVLTSDAGSSDEVSKNRGFMFIPEIGDQVLVCFRYNDADRPFVLGSIFHGKTGGGGGPDNNVKSLSSRSGHVIELNDEKGAESITVKDKNNNIIAIDTAGSSITIRDKNGNNVTIDSEDDSIGIMAKGSITLAAMNINIVAGATVNIQATASYNLNTMNSFSNISKTTMLRTKNLTNMVSEAFSSSATTINQTAKKDINSKAKEKIVISAKDKLEQRAGEMDVATDKGKLRLNSKSDTEIKGTTVKTN